MLHSELRILCLPTNLNSAHCFHSFAMVSRNDAVDIITGSIIEIVSGSISPYSLDRQHEQEKKQDIPIEKEIQKKNR